MVRRRRCRIISSPSERKESKSFKSNLGTTYARLKQENNQWIIEAGGGRPGMTEEEMKKHVKDFIYRDGKLIEKADAH
ncbi:hypothetical protein JOC73_000816 [Alkaliphilus hydrothermalis]|uniref:Uncharacterized protein n=1 Tax=Alkaliphilus hydrothermalis TaxID=1482730 RepID=A0ABS2NMZ4_9FIRM|nr:hypothetical protein [Alkaliphilus hydrothermalis]